MIVRLAGLAASAKSGVCCATTVRLSVVERVVPPPVPVIVTGAAPSVAVAEAVKVTVLLAPVVDAGAKLAVTPEGKPLALNATALENPPVRVIVISLDAFAP